MLRDDASEVKIMESIDYGETDFRDVLEGDSRRFNRYEDESLGSMGFQKQEIDAESGEFVSAEDEADDFEEDMEAEAEFETVFEGSDEE